MFSMNALIRKKRRRRSRRAAPVKKQPRPSGPYFRIDSEWKDGIRKAIDRADISQAELARRIGASPGSIVLLFKEETMQSRLVPAIHQVLGLDPPPIPIARAA